MSPEKMQRKRYNRIFFEFIVILFLTDIVIIDIPRRVTFLGIEDANIPIPYINDFTVLQLFYGR